MTVTMCEVVSPDRIRSEDQHLHYRFMRELLYPPVLGTKDNYWSKVGKKGAQHDLKSTHLRGVSIRTTTQVLDKEAPNFQTVLSYF